MQSCVSHCCKVLSVLILIFTTLFSSTVFALRLEPSTIQETEGVFVAFDLWLDPEDWQVPNQAFLDLCGAGTNWVALFNLEGVSGTATFDVPSPDQDLYFNSSGNVRIYTYQSWYHCSTETNPPASHRVHTNISLEIVDDQLLEPQETASIETSRQLIGQPYVLVDTINITISDPFLEPGVLTISGSGSVSFDEDVGSVGFTVTRTSGTDGEVCVDANSYAGTATFGVDYEVVFETFCWPDGDSSDRSLNVIIYDDEEVEADETFDVDINNPTGGATLGHSRNTLTIINDDVLPVSIDSFSANPLQIDEGDSTRLSWSVSNADDCSASGGSGGWSGSSISLPSGSKDITPTADGTHQFDLNCSNSGSSDSDSVSVTVSPLPESDLSSNSVSANPTTLDSGDSLTISATIRNDGTASASSSTVRYYLSDNTSIGRTDTLLGTTNSPSLNVGSSHSAELQSTVSAEAGQYWVGVCVDVVSNESITSNNCRAGPRITINEDAGSACNSSSISCGASLSGNLSSADCTTGPQGAGHYAEKFTFSGAVGDSLFLDASWNGGLDGYLLLENPNGLIVAETTTTPVHPILISNSNSLKAVPIPCGRLPSSPVKQVPISFHLAVTVRRDQT